MFNFQLKCPNRHRFRQVYLFMNLVESSWYYLIQGGIKRNLLMLPSRTDNCTSQRDVDELCMFGMDIKEERARDEGEGQTLWFIPSPGPLF